MSKKDTRAAKDARETKDGGDVSDHAYDAIIVGGGHNGLVNGAYLAKSGLRVLILERRHLVGGAAITEELWPGSAPGSRRSRRTSSTTRSGC